LDEGGLALKDNVHLILSKDAILKALPTGQDQYQIVRIFGKKNVTIEGGTLQGERNEHTGTTGEWGYGISVQGGENITIKDLKAIDCWGDGINLQFISSTINIPENIIIENVKCLNNRRQGMSIEGLINGVIKDSQFSLTNGTAPGTGVDIEPRAASGSVKNVSFENCLFANNQSSGMLIRGSMISGVNVSLCKFIGNTDTEAHFKTFADAKNITISECYFEKDGGSSTGVLVQDGEKIIVINNILLNCTITTKIVNTALKNVLIEGNQLKVNVDVYSSFGSSDGIELMEIKGNTFDFSESIGESFFRIRGVGTSVSHNKFLGVKRGLSIISPNAKIFNNEIHGSGLEAGLIASSGVLFKGNVISGAGHNNDGSPSFRLLSSATSSIVLDNNFNQESQITVSGTGKSNLAISTDSTLTGLIIIGNTSKSSDNSSSYPVLGAFPISDDNVIEEGTSASGTTSQRTLRAYVGDIFFDTDLNKPIWCKTRASIDSAGTITSAVLWVDSTGTSV